jgi:uncharacterized RDD family membrane protein YckC
VAGARVFCNQCGQPTEGDAAFCSHCGTAQATTAPAFAPAQRIRHDTFVCAAGTFQYARFGIRLVAALIDGVLRWSLLYPLGFWLRSAIGLAGAGVGMPWRGVSAVNRMSVFALGVLVGWMYAAFFESSVWQATIGKKLVGLRVTDLEGNRISPGRATVRYFSKFLSMLGLGFGYLNIIWSPRAQGWHDEIAKTLVLRD